MPQQVGLRLRRTAAGVDLSSMPKQGPAVRPEGGNLRPVRRQLSGTPEFATPQRLHSTLGRPVRGSPAAVSVRSSDDAVAALVDAIGEQTRQNRGFLERMASASDRPRRSPSSDRESVSGISPLTGIKIEQQIP